MTTPHCTQTAGLHNDGCDCPAEPHVERIGDFTITRRQDRDTLPPYYTLTWLGTPFPGSYSSRDAVLIAIGMITEDVTELTCADLHQQAAYTNLVNPIRGRISTNLIMAMLKEITA